MRDRATLGHYAPNQLRATVDSQTSISVHHETSVPDVVPRQLHTSHGGLTRSTNHAVNNGHGHYS